MDYQVSLQLFQWIFLLHIPLYSGYPHNLLVQRSGSETTLKQPFNYTSTSKIQVPYFFHKTAITGNSRKQPKVQLQTSDQNGANLENLEKYIKQISSRKNANSAGLTSNLGNKQGIDSYLRYLPRNLEIYFSHSKKKETQRIGTGTVLHTVASKHVTHLSGSQTIHGTGTYSEHAALKNRKHSENKLSQTRVFSKDNTQGESNTRELITDLKGAADVRNHLQKRHVTGRKPKDRINFAVLEKENVTSGYKISNMILGVGAGIVVLGMGIVLGIFGCCCRKKKVETEKDKEEQNAIINTAEEMDKGLPDAPLDLSDSSKEEEEPKSIKDKIKAFENENKLIIPPPTTPQGKIRNSEAFTALEGKQLFIGMTKPPKVIVREDPDDSKSKDEGLGDTTESQTEDLSKSDTHEEVSEIALDNTSTHSSISQPHNPDVVIASDDEDEFADIQRGTVILKSFQRAKPPRNRSPATRSNRKLRQKSPGHHGKSGRDSPDISRGSDSISPLMSQSLYVESASEKLDSSARDKSGSVPDNLDRLEPVSIPASLRNSSGEIQNKSKSKGGSSHDVDKNKDIPNGARYRKNMDSPLTKPKYRKKEKDSESSADSDSRKRISLSELENKLKGSASAIDSKSKTEEKQSKPPEQTETEEQAKTGETENNVKRLSGLPANVNNIFYLIDPTVKDKCRSAGDVNASNNHKKGKSKDAAHKKDKASKHKASKDSKAKEEDVTPQKRERTLSDPQRHSKEMENTAL